MKSVSSYLKKNPVVVSAYTVKLTSSGCITEFHTYNFIDCYGEESGLGGVFPATNEMQARVWNVLMPRINIKIQNTKAQSKRLPNNANQLTREIL